MRCISMIVARSTLWTVGPMVALLLGAGVHGQQDLTPDTTVRGPVLKFDFPEIHIGIAEYAQGPTGVTVFYFPEPVKAAIDVRGGAPGVVNSETLRLQQESAFTNAVCFAGGSSYGLSAATGVANALKEKCIDEGDWKRIADVTGAIIFDLGDRRLNTVTPDDKLGSAALRSAKPGAFPLGAQGAGRFTMQGWVLGYPQHSGQGGAFRQVGQTKVAVFTVVNSTGAIVDKNGKVVRCGPNATDDCGLIVDALQGAIDEYVPSESPQPAQGATSNTTITLVVTNERMPILELRRMAIQVHGSMARAIQPFATIHDGDVLVAVTTGQVETEGLFFEALGILASEVAWDAVLASVPQLPESGPSMPVTWSDSQLDAVVGEYRFSRWANLRVERTGDTLLATGPDKSNLYFPDKEPVILTPVSVNELLIDGARGYRLRVERKQSTVVALILEPGPWEQRAERVELSR